MSSEELNKTSPKTHLQDSLFDDILDKTEQFGNPFVEMLWANEKKKAMQKNVSPETTSEEQSNINIIVAIATFTFIRYSQIANASKPTRNGSFIYGATLLNLLTSTTNDC